MYRTRPQDEGRLCSEFRFSQAFTQQYELGEKIGKGAHATVHIATDRVTGERVAVKVMPKQLGPNGFLDPHFVRRVRNEVDIASHLCGSLNVCFFHGAYESDAAVHLVLELLSGGPLWDRISSNSYGERAAARLVREVLRTVAQCHSKGIMMRDIKPHNFMFATQAEDSPLKAVDFGISVFCRPGEVIKQRAGTRIVMAPEVVRCRYGLKADLWSVGIMAYMLLTGRLPFPFYERLFVSRQKVPADEMYAEILHAPLDFESPPWDTLSADAADLVALLLDRDQERRPTAKEALKHRWLQDAEGSADGEDVPLNRGIVQRLQRFGTYGRLKQVALRTVANHIPTDSTTIADLRGIFLELDPSDSGRVPYTRLQQELEDGTYTVSSAEARQLLGQLAMTEDGSITFTEWVAALMDWSKMYESSEWDVLVERAFHAIDKDGSGTLTADELELVLCGDEGCQAPDDLDAAMREADLLDAEGGIGLEQFRALLAGEIGDRLDLFETRLPSNMESYSGTMDSTMDSTMYGTVDSDHT
ncbi:hypothetical protein C2E20_0993 [Micractinium conductrix]|uniref:Uncharacterized protein n=1 Tax=Micractinium conductrix TaxID=554055 RepID=A0A2P6VN42_9CHLO|nr:hypothetical protein C2E20_0993 [Micractinium conductrix]|eukprot:PSC75499.1 hypothetical protein C2E20_0993 [Micractinium conductrix]